MVGTEIGAMLMFGGGIRYNARATNNVMPVGMNFLSELVVRPGMKKRMWPLCLYRGSTDPGRAHRLWNFGLLMYAAEAETLADGLKLAHNKAFAQLCGPVNLPSKVSLNSFFGRLWDNPDVTDNISGFTEYVKSLQLGPSRLRPVALESDEQFVASWRISNHPDFDPRAVKPETGTKALYYPYLAHDPTSSKGSDLVLLANSIVPETLPHDLRADVCQELIVSILSGIVTRENAPDFVHKHIGKVFKSVAFKYEAGGSKTSFDAPLPGTEDLRLHDVISDGSYVHWSEQMQGETNGEH